jgi:hypothetical protein
MAKKTEIQTNFTAGELSPRLYAHVDVNKYKNGLKTATNCRVLPHGPVIRRNGTQYIEDTKTHAKESRLLRFQFSQSSAYILEFGHQYIRFYRDGGQIQSGGSPYEVATTFDESELFEITYVQFGNTIYLAHSNHAPKKLVWTSDASWALSDIAFYPPATYEAGYKPVATITPSATTGTSINFTASAAVFLPGDVGRQIHNLAGAGKASIISYTSTTVVVADIIEDFPNTSAIASQSWKLDLSPIAKLRPNGTKLGSIITIRAIDAGTDGTYSPGTTLTPGATTGSSIAFVPDLDVFTSADVGKLISNLDGPGSATIASVYSATNISAATQANPIVVTSNSHGLSNGDKVFIKGVGGMEQINSRVFKVANVAANTVELHDTSDNAINSTGYNAYTSGGTIHKMAVVANITEDFPNTAGISSGSWELSLPINTFRAADVGKYLLLHNGIASITQVVSGSSIKAEVQKSLNSVDVTESWSIEEEVWNSTNGYPSVVAIHQQRLIFASTDLKPQTVWMSESGVFDSMGVGTGDSDAIDVELSSSQINQAQWMLGINDDIAIGTLGAEVTLGTGQVAGPLSPTSILQRARSYNGATLQQPLGIGNEILYVQRSGRKVQSFRYDFSVDNYVSENLTFLAEHLTSGIIKEISYAQDPDRTIYAVLEDGSMIVGTYARDQQIIAWTKYTTDGYFESVQTISTGQYDEVWVIVKRTIGGSTKRYVELFDLSDGEDNLDGFSDSYLTYSVPKTITGITKANPAVVTSASHGFTNGQSIKIIDVEGMTEANGKTYVVASAAANTFELTTSSGANVDSTSYTTYSSGGEAHRLVSTISGLDHLEGKTVQVKADGASHPDRTVASGAITLASPAYEVTVGLSYETIVKTLSREYNLGTGTQQGQQGRWVRPVLRLYKSVFPLLNGEFTPARTPSDLMDSKLDLYSGDVYYGGLAWDNSLELSITVDTPFPFLLLGVFGSVDGGVQ